MAAASARKLAADEPPICTVPAGPVGCAGRAEIRAAAAASDRSECDGPPSIVSVPPSPSAGPAGGVGDEGAAFGGATAGIAPDCADGRAGGTALDDEGFAAGNAPEVDEGFAAGNEPEVDAGLATGLGPVEAAGLAMGFDPVEAAGF